MESSGLSLSEQHVPVGLTLAWLHLYFHQIMNLPRSKHPLYCCEQKSIPRLHKSPPDKWQHCYLETCGPNAAVSCANKISPCAAFDHTPGYEDSHLLMGLWWAVWWDLSNGSQPGEGEVLRRRDLTDTPSSAYIMENLWTFVEFQIGSSKGSQMGGLRFRFWQVQLTVQDSDKAWPLVG